MPHNYYNRTARALRAASLPLFFLFSSFSSATTLKLAWDPSGDPTIVGYKIAYGTSSRNYTKSVDAGNSTSASVTSLISGATYYFVVTAYNSVGLQSVPSNEVALTLPNNVPPSVSLTSPQSGSSFNGPSPIGLSATATDSDGTIVKVEFYEDTNKIGESTTAPYSATWSNPSFGSSVLTALAYDDSGAAVRSAGVPITVNGGTPANNPSPAAAKVRVMAMTPLIKAGATAKFKVTTSVPDKSAPMVVNYAVGGTATGGVDYSMTGVTGQITIPAGSRGTLLPITTLSVPGTTGNKTAILTIMPGAAYTPGRGTAVVKILHH